LTTDLNDSPLIIAVREEPRGDFVARVGFSLGLDGVEFLSTQRPKAYDEVKVIRELID